MSFPMRHGPPAPPGASVNSGAARAARGRAPTGLTPFESPRCVTQLRDAAFTQSRPADGPLLQAAPRAVSPPQKLAYLKTPKAASIAIQELFQRSPDHVGGDPRDAAQGHARLHLRARARRPRHRRLAEIDVTYARRASAEKRQQMNTTFHRMATRSRSMSSGEQGARRLLAFLDDPSASASAATTASTGRRRAYPQVNFACRQRTTTSATSRTRMPTGRRSSGRRAPPRGGR